MLETIKNVICTYVDVDPESITEETKLRADAGLNSFDMVNLAVDLESEFGVKFDSKQFSTIKTVGDLMEYIESLKR